MGQTRLPTLRRYPGERRALLVALLISAVVTLIFTPLSGGLLLLVIVGGVLLNWFQTASNVRQIHRTAAPVAQFPEVAALAERCKQRLGIEDELQVFVAKSDTINAFATGFRAPYTVVLYTGLIDALDEDELAFVIGHELGHVMMGHTTLLTLIGQLGYQSYGTRGLQIVFRMAFLSWMRTGEYTADRAGLVACQNLNAALSTQLMLTMGREKSRRVDLDALVEHWREVDVGFSEDLGRVMSTHPGVEARIDRLVDFVHG